MFNNIKTELENVWSRRSLILAFAIHDLKVRYRNSVLGFLWSIVEPLLILSVLYIVFTNIFKNEIEFYILYLLLGLVIWFFFMRATNMSLTSILSRGHILSKVYMPKEILPISSVLTAFFMSILEIGVFFVFMIPMQFIPPVTLLIFPIVIVIEFIFILGISMPLSVINVKFRDIQYIWAVVLQAGFFSTPIFYSLDILPDLIQRILSYVPMVIIMEMARDVVIYNKIPNMENFGYLIASSIAILFVGYFIFKKFESKIIEEL